MVVVGRFRGSAELRKKARRPFQYRARLLIDREEPPLSCTIADISAGGVRFVLEQEVELPTRFVLLLTLNGQTRRICQLIWQDKTTAGAKFV